MVLGGYDFKRELEGSKFLRGELKDGMPRVQITGINVHMPETQMMMDVGETVEAQIDSSVPWIHLPPPIATRMREVRENQVNDDGTLVRERRYGNITMTLRVLDEPTGGAREINVTFPESSKSKSAWNYFQLGGRKIDSNGLQSGTRITVTSGVLEHPSRLSCLC